jgi:hypothetical protein
MTIKPALRYYASIIIVLFFALCSACSRPPLKVLPIRSSVDKHAITSGYTLTITNQGAESMRWSVTEVQSGQTKKFLEVVDRGRNLSLSGLVAGDIVKIDCDGYEGQIFPIK